MSECPSLRPISSCPSALPCPALFCLAPPCRAPLRSDPERSFPASGQGQVQQHHGGCVQRNVLLAAFGLRPQQPGDRTARGPVQQRRCDAGRYPEDRPIQVRGGTGGVAVWEWPTLSSQHQEDHGWIQAWRTWGEALVNHAWSLGAALLSTLSCTGEPHHLSTSVLVLYVLREPPDEGIMCELLWSDPSAIPGRQPSKRGVGVAFGERRG